MDTAGPSAPLKGMDDRVLERRKSPAWHPRPPPSVAVTIKRYHPLFREMMLKP